MIRPARPQEAQQLSALALRSKAYWGYSAAFMAACREELTWLAEDVKASEGLMFIEENGHELAGFYALERTGPDGFELDALFVEPRFIGAGIGRRLLEHAKRTATSLGGRVLLVQADPHAERFYRAAGGELVGRRKSRSIPDTSLPMFSIALPGGAAP